jgi:hypothetical protein
MATNAETIAAYNNAIAQGLDPAAAYIAAGLTDENSSQFSTNDQGRLELDGGNRPVSDADLNREVGTDAPANPPAASSIESSPETVDTDIDFTGANETNSTTESGGTTVTGGATTTTINQPTQYTNTPASTSLQAQADSLQSQKDARTAELKAQGATSAQILRDPEIKALSNEKVQVEYAAQQAKEPVPGTGGQTVTVTPNTDANTEAVYKGSPDSQTNNAGGSDPAAQTAEINQTSALVPTSAVVGAPPGVEVIQSQPVASVVVESTDFLADDPYPSLSEEEQQLQDNPIALSEEDVLEQDNPYPSLSEEEQQEQDNPILVSEEDVLEQDNPYPSLSEEEQQEQDNPNVDNPAPVLTEEEQQQQDNPDFIGTEEEQQEQDNPVENSAEQQATLDKARAQNTIANQRSNKNNADWRVKLRLAPLADYLYKASNPGILKPLVGTDGVLFPYTPTIQTTYKATYSQSDITHSNYKGYFYQGSSVEPVTISCPFTAQSTAEAEYLLAVIHFFKSVTKMFYGQDPQRGAPPPLVYLTGLGEFQYNEHPCVVTSFTYELPAEVDYLRAYSPNVNNSNMLAQRQSNNPIAGGLLGGLLGGAVSRLMNARLPAGGMVPMSPPPPTLGSGTIPTYVPTKMNISIQLLPVISRKRQSQDFSVRQYANGDLLKGGMW